MPFVLLAGMLSLTGIACRRILLMRRMGAPCRALRCCRRAGTALGTGILLAMALQEAILWRAGLLTWATGLPLHLCSLAGLTALPMLRSERSLLRGFSLFAGMPGAALALVFPAVLPTPWPALTSLAFHTMHAGLVCAPLLPLAAGWRPSPRDALHAGGFLLAAGLAAMAVNALTGGNYLFLAGPVEGTPLALLAQWGPTAYRLLLAGLAGLALCIGAGICAAVGSRPEHTPART